MLWQKRIVRTKLDLYLFIHPSKMKHFLKEYNMDMNCILAIYVKSCYIFYSIINVYNSCMCFQLVTDFETWHIYELTCDIQIPKVVETSSCFLLEDNIVI